MPFSRRDLLARTGATITYIICARQSSASAPELLSGPDDFDEERYRGDPGIRHRDWIKITDDGLVTAFTARNELGQGVSTLLVNVLSQGLELPPERIRVVMGDTDLCPNDGPTTGSTATRHVVWSFWSACFAIRDDFMRRASALLGQPEQNLVYDKGMVHAKGEPSRTIAYSALATDQVTNIRVSKERESGSNIPDYIDPATVNVHADALVTGRMRYTADLPRQDALYGGLVLPPYHRKLAKWRSVDVSAALSVPGVRKAGVIDRKYIGVVGDSYTAVQNGLAAIDVRWKEPDAPATLSLESAIRKGRRLVKVLEHRGNPLEPVSSQYITLSETYISQHGTQVPIEPDTALAEKRDGKFVIHLGTQNPFKVRAIVAGHFDIPEEHVRIISMPTGGAFGAKTGHLVGLYAAMLADWAEAPVRLVHSRREDIQRLGRYKSAVVFDVTSAVDDQGHLLSQKIAIHQDVGRGTRGVYEIPHVHAALYNTPLPFDRAIMRGTSYTQNVWALESHVDMLAAAAGVDPLEFRRRNVKVKEFLPLIDSCAELIDYRGPSAKQGHGIGFAVIRHGGFELGVVAANVRVDTLSGDIRVLQMAGAFDIGLVMNSTMAETGVKSAMLWGLSWALLEEVKLDGHRCHTAGFMDYKIARFEHTPEIKVRFLGDTSRGPWGCGEMPAPPVAAAICNAVYHATGIRFYDLPLTPQKLKAALAARVSNDSR